jgi:hypothetical protein
MANAPIVEQLIVELKNAAWDIKAEPQLAMAQAQGLSTDDYLVSCNKKFTREYSRDLVSAGISETGANAHLQIQLSRSGIYDQLPEGLFFQATPRSGNGTVPEMASDYKKNKKREEQIRQFFLPFENDFFLQRVDLEEQETYLLEGLQSGYLNDYFGRFWNLPSSLHKGFIGPLVLLLPYAFKISGDINLLTQSLEEILKEPVRISLGSSTFEDGSCIEVPVLGETQLGLDMVCGADFKEDSPVYEIEIGPLQNSRITDYLHGASRNLVMETFTRFFIPAGIETNISIKVSPGEKYMRLDTNEEPILGYSTFL